MNKLFLSESQIHQLLELARSHPRDYSIMQVAASTGLRSCDLVKLKRSDVLDCYGNVQETVTIRQKKTNRTITCKLREGARRAIKDYLATRRDCNDHLFISEATNALGSEKPLNRRAISEIIRHYLSGIVPESERKGNAAHALRRSVAKLISERAGRVEPATAFLGHASIASTMAYIDIDGHGRKANEILASLDF